MRNAALLLTLLLAGCDVWISSADFKDFETRQCEASFAALDLDGDGYLPSDVAPPERCPLTLDELLAQQGLALGDCGEGDAEVYPGAPDPCDDEVDQDCDGVDPAFETWYTDQDMDGYGAPETAEERCGAPEGAVQNGDDCDDADDTINPDGVELACADGVDGDCDGVTACNVHDEVSVARSDWTAYGQLATVSLALYDATFAVGEDLNGDGVRDASMSVPEGAFSLIWTGDDFEVGAVPASGDTLSPGALAMLPDPLSSGDIALAWGVPAGGAAGAGAVVVSSLRGDRVTLRASADEAQVGLQVGDGDDGFAVSAHNSVTVASWSALIVDDNDVPEADAALDDVISARVSLGQGNSGSMYSLSMVPANGHDDLLASWAPGLDPVRACWFEGPLTDDSEARVAVTHSSRIAAFGANMALMDIDGTGEQDLVISASEEGRVYIVTDPSSGEISSDDADYGIDGIGNYGAALANIGDFDGDGVSDLVVGVSEDDHIDLILGGTTLFKTYATVSGSVSSELGDAVAGYDMDADGFSDLLITAPEDSAVYLLWGGP